MCVYRQLLIRTSVASVNQLTVDCFVSSQLLWIHVACTVEHNVPGCVVNMPLVALSDSELFRFLNQRSDIANFTLKGD